MLTKETTVDHDSQVEVCSLLIHDQELCTALYGDDAEYQEYLVTHREYEC